ncbi:glycoside hydrolase family 88 protein [Paenibacillus sp. CC-CFT747]|nr:glycoside hydrolase family 88 protein [Paenibacillus sp. CC-CFT747]
MIDLVPLFKDWVSRIHIGRYADQEGWNAAITARGVKWLNATPKIKVTDNTRLIAIDMWKGNYTKSAIQHWQEAALLLGLAEQMKRKEDPATRTEISKYLQAKLDDNGQWRELPQLVDGAILAYALMKVEGIVPGDYRRALDATWEMIREHIGGDGTVQYRKFMKNYRYVDTIGFICPFLISYGIRYGHKECVDLAVRQILAYEEHGMLEERSIPCHAYHTESKVPLGLFGWGRGLGWFAIGLIDAWGELPANHLYKPLLDASVKRFAKAAIAFQQEDGRWNWTVTRQECSADSSATATLGWYMRKASAMEEISEPCRASAEKAIAFLMKNTRRDGAVDFSQGDTKDIGVYSMNFNILPFTQGFCIRLMNSDN